MFTLPTEILILIVNDLSLQEMHYLASTSRFFTRKTQRQLNNLKDLFIFAQGSFATLQQNYIEINKYYHFQKVSTVGRYQGCLLADLRTFSLKAASSKELCDKPPQFFLNLKFGKPEVKLLEPTPSLLQKLMPGLYDMLYEYRVPIKNYHVEFQRNKTTKEMQVIKLALKVLKNIQPP